MNQNLIERIIHLMKQKMRNRRWRMTVTSLSAVLVFAITYALVLPAVTMTGSHPSLEAEELTAVSGEELTVRVTAKADNTETEKTVILIADGEGADLSASYAFNEDGICVITDEAGKEIELHRSARENSRKKQVIDYWFTLPAGEETSFTLDLIDEVDENRFAKLVEAVQESAQASENAAAAETGNPGTASASDAQKAAPAAAKAKASSAAAATSSNASRASWSNADIAEANAAAADPEERIVTEENDSGFVEILDGKVVNDLADADSSDDEDEERVRAALRLSAGIGNDYAASVKDAEKNADKRGNAELRFTWTEKQEEHELVKPELTVSVGDAKIAVICDDEAVLPSDAWISAYEIGFGTPDYEALAAQAAGAVAENAGVNEKSVTRARFFDITIYDGAGNEIQPEGDVKVIITYEKQNASENDGEMNVVHFGEDGPQVVDLDEAETADDRDSMEFTASSFSIYGIVYTVDFEYELNGTVFTYQLEGGESISLKALIVKLGVLDADKAEAFVDTQVENVRFSDESLVKVTRVNGDWMLESIAPFITEEVLTVSLKDGRQVTVKVTDSQDSADLTNFVSNVWFEGVEQDEAGDYHVEAGKEYSIRILFEETTSYQFANRSQMTYQIPEGIKILSEQGGGSSINVSYRGEIWPVAYSYHIDDETGKLTVTFDQSDPNFHLLEKATNVSFSISYHGEFEETIKEIEFAEDLERTIVFDEPKPGNAYAEKTATYDETTGVFHYTIMVTADGDVTNVNVKDVITGNALVFNNDVQVLYNNANVTGNSSIYTKKGAANGFDYTFGSMKKGDVIKITYSANVNFEMDTDNDGRITVDQTKNTVTVKPDPGEPHTSEYSREINYKTTSKSNGVEAGQTEDGDKIIEWTIDYNPLALVAVGGDTITDRIGTASAAYMKYYGNGITVMVYDKNGTQVGNPRQIAYADLTSHSDSSWTYTIPESDTTPYSYKITYRTIVDMDALSDTSSGSPVMAMVWLDNTANDAHGGIYVKPDIDIDVKKDVESYTTTDVNWVATLDIPENGLTQAVVTDTLPSRLWEGVWYYDRYIARSLEITELIGGEEVVVAEDYYTVEYPANTVKITFYQDAEHTVTGLAGKHGGRKIIVRLTTTVDQDWLEKGYEAQEYVKNHINTIDLNGVADTATVTFAKTGIEKKVSEEGKAADGSIKYLKYSVLLSGVSEVPVTVVDTFDTDLLEVDTNGNSWDHMRIFGGYRSEAGAQIYGRVPVSYTDTSNGIILTADAVPMDNGQYYPYYRIDYYLKLKDGVDLEALAMANGGEYDLENTAVWSGHETTYTYRTIYDYLDKKLLNEGELSPTNRTAEYQITFNSKKALLYKGEPMTMTDTLSSNLSVDYGSIQIETDPAGAEVPYSLSGGEGGTTVATYTVPDATKVVITYKALVVGNAEQTIVNKVKVNGRDKTVEAKKDYGSASEGQAGASYFKIVKVDKYDANKKLPGVEFKVYADDPELDFGKDKQDRPYGKVLTLTTDENGEIYLDGGTYQLFFNKVYHIQEIKPPADYGINNVDYTVTLTNKMSEVDYGKYIYYFTGDSMQIKNTPLEGLVVEKQVESDEPGDKTREYQFKISILKDDGTVNTEYNEKNGDDQFENGEFTFKLKDGQQKMFWGFSKGTKYKVEELDADGFAVSVTYNIFDEDGNITETKTDTGKSHTGEFTHEHEVIIFKNTKTRNGVLKVSKILVSAAAADADQKFTFTVTLGDTSINGIYGDMTFTDGVATVELKGGESLKAEGLPTGITYSVTEEAAEGFELTGRTGDEGTINASPSNAQFTNTPVTKLEVEKTWLNDGKTWPEGVTVEIQLTADGEDVAGKTATLNEDHPSYTFEKLPKYQADRKTVIAYSVKEKEVDGYISEVGTLGNGKITVTNTQKTEATVRKVWDDNNDQDRKRPEELKATLSNGTEVTLNDENHWEATVTDLPKYDPEGNEILYTWTEGKMPEGYVFDGATPNGTITTLTNRYAPEKTSATIKKVWDDDGDRDGIRPDELKVELSDGTEVTLNDENKWEATVTDLPKYDSQHNEITYTWSEKNIPKGYKLTTAVEGTITTITNKHIPETVNVIAVKEWKDAEGNDLTTVPEGAEVTFTLKADGDPAKEIKVNAGNEWTASFTGLPKYKDHGTEIKYSVEETVGWTGYGSTTVKENGIIYIINQEKSVDINILKVDKDDAKVLTGAKFQLFKYTSDTYREKEEGWEAPKKEVDQEGQLKYEKLTVGYYELIETEPPKGYVKTSSNPRFQIAENEKTKELEVEFKDESGMVTYASPSNASPSDASAASDGWTFTVRNEKGTSLPSTGGPGPALYTLCGAALLMVSALMYGFRMRHRA